SVVSPPEENNARNAAAEQRAALRRMKPRGHEGIYLTWGRDDSMSANQSWTIISDASSCASRRKRLSRSASLVTEDLDRELATEVRGSDRRRILRGNRQRPSGLVPTNRLQHDVGHHVEEERIVVDRLRPH